MSIRAIPKDFPEEVLLRHPDVQTLPVIRKQFYIFKMLYKSWVEDKRKANPQFIDEFFDDERRAFIGLFGSFNAKVVYDDYQLNLNIFGVNVQDGEELCRLMSDIHRMRNPLLQAMNATIDTTHDSISAIRIDDVPFTKCEPLARHMQGLGWACAVHGNGKCTLVYGQITVVVDVMFLAYKETNNGIELKWLDTLDALEITMASTSTLRELLQKVSMSRRGWPEDYEATDDPQVFLNGSEEHDKFLECSELNEAVLHDEFDQVVPRVDFQLPPDLPNLDIPLCQIPFDGCFRLMLKLRELRSPNLSLFA
jgi:hypothetical protein